MEVHGAEKTLQQAITAGDFYTLCGCTCVGRDCGTLDSCGTAICQLGSKCTIPCAPDTCMGSTCWDGSKDIPGTKVCYLTGTVTFSTAVPTAGGYSCRKGRAGVPYSESVSLGLYTNSQTNYRITATAGVRYDTECLTLGCDYVVTVDENAVFSISPAPAVCYTGNYNTDGYVFVKDLHTYYVPSIGAWQNVKLYQKI